MTKDELWKRIEKVKAKKKEADNLLDKKADWKSYRSGYWQGYQDALMDIVEEKKRGLLKL